MSWNCWYFVVKYCTHYTINLMLFWQYSILRHYRCYSPFQLLRMYGYRTPRWTVWSRSDVLGTPLEVSTSFRACPATSANWELFLWEIHNACSISENIPKAIRDARWSVDFKVTAPFSSRQALRPIWWKECEHALCIVWLRFSLNQ
jgi:hypothetical protein